MNTEHEQRAKDGRAHQRLWRCCRLAHLWEHLDGDHSRDDANCGVLNIRDQRLAGLLERHQPSSEHHGDDRKHEEVVHAVHNFMVLAPNTLPGCPESETLFAIETLVTRGLGIPPRLPQ